MSSDQSISEAADHEEEDETITNPYGFAEENTSFGIMKKTVYYPKSDFSLTLLHFVTADNFTGYICSVRRDHDEQERCEYYSTYSYLLHCLRILKI